MLPLIVNALENTLNVKISIAPIEFSNNTDKRVFVEIINKLEDLYNREHSIYEQYKVDLVTVNEPFWEAVEMLVSFCFEDEVAEVIWWYIYDRKTPAGDLKTWVDENGNEYKFENASQLYEYIFEQDSI